MSKKKAEQPDLDVEDGSGEEEEEDSVYDSAVEEEYDSNVDDEDGSSDDGSSDDDDDDFEDQGSSDDDDDLLAEQAARGEEESDLELLPDDDDEGVDYGYENSPRHWQRKKRPARPQADKDTDDPTDKCTASSPIIERAEPTPQSLLMHTDDLSSDDEKDDGTTNRIGRIPLHWYDDYDHLGYDAHGAKVMKSVTGAGDTLDEAIKQSNDLESGTLTVYDALHDREVVLSERQIELLRRIQHGSYAHPEFDGTPDYVDYFTGVDKEISGLTDNRYEPKSRFQPSKYEKLMVRRLLHRLKCGSINMDYLTGKVKDMNDVVGKHGKPKQPKDGDAQPFLLWKGDEEDELALRKGPQHIAAPKQLPPSHAESYNPSEEYLPTDEELKQWEEMDVKDRPHGLLVPKKFGSLRHVGAYEHSVRERFERCLDLYLCPRVMKRRLNIDPESLVPSLPKASDLRPFPTARCVRYDTPYNDNEEPPAIRCLSVSPDGQFLASGATDGYVRLWEVQSGRLLRSWDVSALVGDGDEAGGGDGDADAKEQGSNNAAGSTDAGEKNETSTENQQDGETGSGTRAAATEKPVVSLAWNPNRSHHCLLAACGNGAVVLATGTGSVDDSELTEALLSAAMSTKGSLKNAKAAKAVKWISLTSRKAPKKLDTKPVSAYGGTAGPICLLRTNKEVSSVRWHHRGDYFVTVSPKAGAATVLIHQLSKANSQQPFSKSKGEVQCACFHPNKPFLFVASQQHIRVYHLIRQEMVKRLVSGCRWISSIDVHPTGDHIIAGSLDRRMVWFDLDLSSIPYKTLKYHERALRSVGYHARYPLFATASDDGSVHVFHGMVYSDLMRNPLVVPVKVLRGHKVVNKLGVLSFVFHPTQPWLFSAGADGQIHLYQDI